MAYADLDASPVDPAPIQTQVRAARIDDLQELTNVLATSFYAQTGWTRWAYPVLRLGILEDMKQRLRSPKAYYACLAAIQQPLGSHGQTLRRGQGQVAGTVEISRRQAAFWQPLPGQHVYLSNLAVHPQYRRQGIAQKLLKTCEHIALDWGFAELYLHVMEDNTEARRLYRKLGFCLSHQEETLLNWLGLQPRRLLLQKTLKRPTR